MTEVELVMQTISFSLFGCDTDISLVSGFNLIEGVASLSNAWLFWRLKLSGVDAPRLARCFFSFTDLDEEKIDTSNFGDI